MLRIEEKKVAFDDQNQKFWSLAITLNHGFRLDFDK